MKFEREGRGSAEDRLLDRLLERPAARAARIRRKKVDRTTRALIQKLVREDDMSPDLADEIVRARMRRWARLGGIARAKSLSPARRRAIARQANAARRGK